MIISTLKSHSSIWQLLSPNTLNHRLARTQQVFRHMSSDERSMLTKVQSSFVTAAGPKYLSHRYKYHPCRSILGTMTRWSTSAIQMCLSESGNSDTSGSSPPMSSNNRVWVWSKPQISQTVILWKRHTFSPSTKRTVQFRARIQVATSDRLAVATIWFSHKASTTNRSASCPLISIKNPTIKELLKRLKRWCMQHHKRIYTELLVRVIKARAVLRASMQMVFPQSAKLVS